MARPKKNINELLEKYWNAETDLQEEAQLKAFFKDDQNEVDDPLAEYFKFLEQEQNLKSSKDFLAEIRSLEQEESTSSFAPARRIKMIPRKWISIAASLLILVMALFWFTNRNQTSPLDQDTFDDPMMAWEATKEALTMLNTKMNSGTKSMEKVTELNKLSIIKKT